MDLTLSEALAIYRQKDSIDKVFHCFKNEVEIKPLRAWSETSIYGALIIGFVPHLIISLIRFEHEDLKHISPKFIKSALMHLTVTVEFGENGTKRYLFQFHPRFRADIGGETGKSGLNLDGSGRFSGICQTRFPERSAAGSVKVRL